MVTVTFRLDDALHRRLLRRAHGADLSLSAFIRSVLSRAADPDRTYIYSSKDEILAVAIQTFAILVTAVGERSPQSLEKGQSYARQLLDERGLLAEEPRS